MAPIFATCEQIHRTEGRSRYLVSETEKIQAEDVFALSLGFAGVVLAHQAAHAQGQANCAERTQVIERLHTKYGESRRSIGLAANNGVVETYASDDSGTWTIVITLPNGMTCLVAAGNAFQPVEEASLKKGDKV